MSATAAQVSTSCWPPSISKVAPVTAVFVMRWTASRAMSAGPTTRPIGSVVRSCSRRASSWSPRSDADNGVSTNPAAIRLTRIGASSSARFFVRAGSAAVSAEMSVRRSLCGGRRFRSGIAGFRPDELCPTLAER